PWGTSQVLEATLRAGRRSGLRVALLPSWYDVDRPEDLGRLRDDIKACSPFRPERTAAFLAELARSRGPDVTPTG
ncbi:MAG TPA: glycosyltransferase, partial [Candidatus Polarisedimenticolia bacterium]|nr:glycosyltransferase [Candidatus Polarisedimenticolia bacterium]